MNLNRGQEVYKDQFAPAYPLLVYVRIDRDMDDGYVIPPMSKDMYNRRLADCVYIVDEFLVRMKVEGEE